MTNCVFFNATLLGKNAKKKKKKPLIFNFLAFVLVYKNSPIVLLLFCKFNFLKLLPSSYLTSLSSVDIHPNNRDFMALGKFHKRALGKALWFPI